VVGFTPEAKTNTPMQQKQISNQKPKMVKKWLSKSSPELICDAKIGANPARAHEWDPKRPQGVVFVVWLFLFYWGVMSLLNYPTVVQHFRNAEQRNANLTGRPILRRVGCHFPIYLSFGVWVHGVCLHSLHLGWHPEHFGLVVPPRGIARRLLTLRHLAVMPAKHRMSPCEGN
jgi:hypothetical protein